MFSNEKMKAEKCGELKLKTDFLATFGQPSLHSKLLSRSAGFTSSFTRRAPKEGRPCLYTLSRLAWYLSYSVEGESVGALVLDGLVNLDVGKLTGGKTD